MLNPTPNSGNPPCLRDQLSRRSPPRLILEIDISELLAVAVFDDRTGVQFLDSPWRQEAAGGRAAQGWNTIRKSQRSTTTIDIATKL